MFSKAPFCGAFIFEKEVYFFKKVLELGEKYSIIYDNYYGLLCDNPQEGNNGDKIFHFS